MSEPVETIEVISVLAKLAEAERDARELSTDESYRAGQAAGLELAQRIVRELAGLPVEADSSRV
ncbi:hypothetical protein UO65_2606 [Actinokineospora spheciospongiae]|uniref:Uncharacterized protein n=1 Tax=Actinokineospora spheciospongiae TaxID=909613 RepID=W7IZK0_9PSEU|nr:hypothetical protein [Actinokineospora spheciospongiae]EWC62092.1 hypothetical protein UO65_2606 [Actinokineospora spheciospongiae]PWW62162.1 hypothetical protein DFQ13_106418 [Actinokineospora spheciospongiae]